MAPGFDFEARLVRELRADPCAFRGAMRMARGNIDAGDRFGGCGDLRSRSDSKRRQLLGMRSLCGERMAAGFDHPARFLVQLGRVEADDAGQRLALSEAAAAVPQSVGVSRGHFDVITE